MYIKVQTFLRNKFYDYQYFQIENVLKVPDRAMCPQINEEGWDSNTIQTLQF